MFRNLVDKIKLSNKNKLILSIVGFLISVFGGISSALLLQNIWSLVIGVGFIGSLNIWLDLYEDAKKDYCFELSSNYFNKYKDRVKECNERYILEKLVGINKFCSNIQVITIPLSLVLLLLFCILGVSLVTASTVCASMCMSSLFITITLDNVSNFYIDVICEVLEKVKASKGEIMVVSNELSTERGNTNTLGDILTYGNGISKNRYKYVPKDVSARDVSYEEAIEVVSYMRRVLKSTNTRR